MNKGFMSKDGETIMTKKKVLLLTVGTGDVDKLEETLFAPLRKSVSKGEWKEIVLLPSQITMKYADQLKITLGHQSVVINPLSKKKQENNFDQCFDHFNSVVEGLREHGFESDDMVADFTRGTKAMSAALAMAAVRNGIGHLRYITSEQRDRRGQVIAGTEKVDEFNTFRVTASRDLDDAWNLFMHRRFSAVMEILPDHDNSLAMAMWPESSRELVPFIRSAASFDLYWDRMDYTRARKVDIAKLPKGAEKWKCVNPDKHIRGWVVRLAEEMNNKKTESQR